MLPVGTIWNILSPVTKYKCSDAIPDAGITFDVLLTSIFLSIFLLPVWRRIKEWLAMQKVYSSYITSASGVSHCKEVSQTWVRVDSLRRGDSQFSFADSNSFNNGSPAKRRMMRGASERRGVGVGGGGGGGGVELSIITNIDDTDML
jgi:hypothetical protein